MKSRIIARIKGNIKDEEFRDLAIDYVDLHWYEAGKRIHRLTTRSGMDIGIRLESESVARGLLQGDVLTVRDGTAIVVNILEEECIAVKANDVRTVAKVCYEVGNRHTALFYSEDYSELILPYDKPIMEMLGKLGVQASVKAMKIHGDRAISANIGGHEHSHSHDHGHDH